MGEYRTTVTSRVPDERDGSDFLAIVDELTSSLDARAGGVSGESSEGDWDDAAFALLAGLSKRWGVCVPAGGGVIVRRRGLLERTIGSAVPRA